MLSLESTSSRMSNLARQEIYFDRQFSLDETLDGIERVTRDDVQRVAEDLFANGSMAATVVGQTNGLALTQEQAGACGDERTGWAAGGRVGSEPVNLAPVQRGRPCVRRPAPPAFSRQPPARSEQAPCELPMIPRYTHPEMGRIWTESGATTRGWRSRPRRLRRWPLPA